MVRKVRRPLPPGVLTVRALPVRLVDLLVRAGPVRRNARTHPSVPVALAIRRHHNDLVTPVLLELLEVAHPNVLLSRIIPLFPRASSRRAKLLSCPRWVVGQMHQVVRQNGLRRLPDLKSRVVFPVLRRLQHHVRLP